mmetsp:Transcript_45639/g.74407  ORF Transcript_45639/g.74407 Transcript_45639/m.74407 type:complete len:731 (-) Transcript_45639:195-2387(-)
MFASVSRWFGGENGEQDRSPGPKVARPETNEEFLASSRAMLLEGHPPQPGPVNGAASFEPFYAGASSTQINSSRRIGRPDDSPASSLGRPSYSGVAKGALELQRYRGNDAVLEVPAGAQITAGHYLGARAAIQELFMRFERTQEDLVKTKAALQEQTRTWSTDYAAWTQEKLVLKGTLAEREDELRRHKEHNEKEIKSLRAALRNVSSQLKDATQESEEFMHEYLVSKDECEKRVFVAERSSKAVTSNFEVFLKKKAEGLRSELRDMRKQTLHFMDEVYEGINQAYEKISEQLGQKDRDMKVLLGKYQTQLMENARLFDALQESKGKYRVYCRIRPLNQSELSRGISPACIPDKTSYKRVMMSSRASGDDKASVYKFDRVYGASLDQGSVFEDIRPLVTSALNGYDLCIFAYGQTGSGKTYTMEGTAGARGVSHQTFDELFRLIKERGAEYDYSVSATMMEIYNEEVRDLLSPQSTMELWGTSTGLNVPHAAMVELTNLDDVYAMIGEGSAARATAATNVNEHSSRSHCILSVRVEGENRVGGIKTIGKIHLIDLAGSERVAKSEASGDRLKEAQAINKSLSCLGDVIHALVIKSSHVPYRNSKLTYLLQESLATPGCKVVMFLTVNPGDDCIEESTCSLNFAQRVKSIESRPSKKPIANSGLTESASTATPRVVKAIQRTSTVPELSSRSPSSLSAATRGLAVAKVRQPSITTAKERLPRRFTTTTTPR